MKKVKDFIYCYGRKELVKDSITLVIIFVVFYMGLCLI
jgi:hypothetical protein